MTTKVCSKCKVEKDVGEFCKDKYKKSGLNSACRVCANTRLAVWKAKNPEKVKASRAVWKAKNPEKVRGKRARYAAKHPEKARERTARYAAKHPEKAREINIRSHRNSRETLKDSYIRRFFNIPNAPPELIDIKRLTIQIKRELKQKRL